METIGTCLMTGDPLDLRWLKGSSWLQRRRFWWFECQGVRNSGFDCKGCVGLRGLRVRVYGFGLEVNYFLGASALDPG